MQQTVRKMSVGPDYKTAMHYIKGQPIMGGIAEIQEFTHEDGNWVIWAKKDDEIFRWKTVENMPVFIEHDINF